MQLVMFDMDGTLTDSFSLDENCYVLAIEQALGLSKVVTEWESYPHTSSSYCLEEIVRRARGTPPTEAESRAVQQRMVEIMSELHRTRGRATAEIPGAAACLRALRERGYAVALASGDWETTARHKLTTAGIPFADLPTAFCDCSHVRTDIMRTALARASQHYGCATFERIIYVGDAAWDVRACFDLGWPLVAIATGAHAARLQSLGASHVLPDYRDLDAFFLALAHARAPLRQTG
jgi:phosphoglycolate phosphatase-like HAD superfamily hydrolase